MQRSDALLIVASLILGVCVVGSALWLARSVDRAGEEVAGARAAMAQLEEALARGGRPQRPARRGPDPNRVYEIPLAGTPILGPEAARVTVVEFSDFQCPYCAKVAPTMKRIRETYGDRVRIAFKHLPLAMHPKAPLAHAAAVAAGEQGHFWEMHDLIFAHQREMSREKYLEWAAQLELDSERFESDLDSASIRSRVEADKRLASSLGVTGTPAFFINGRYLSGAQPFESFQKLIERELGG